MNKLVLFIYYDDWKKRDIVNGVYFFKTMLEIYHFMCRHEEPWNKYSVIEISTLRGIKEVYRENFKRI